MKQKFEYKLITLNGETTPLDAVAFNKWAALGWEVMQVSFSNMIIVAVLLKRKVENG